MFIRFSCKMGGGRASSQRRTVERLDGQRQGTRDPRRRRVLYGGLI